MKRIAEFQKVSFEEFKKDISNFNFSEKQILDIYESIIIPSRATSGSAGYDFFMPFDLKIEYNEAITIPTGIRVKIKEGWFLSIFPRSGLGFKYQLGLSNTVGIIDSDYYNALNEGHIMIKIVNRSVKEETIILEKNKGFAQGIFLEYGITILDDTEKERKGGFGSTN